MAELESETIFDEPEENKGTEGGEGVEEQPKGEDGAPQDSQKDDLDGLPFKSVKDLAKAYKELQSHSTRRDQELAEVNKALRELAPHLTKPQQKVAEKEAKEDPEAFINAFVNNPRGVLSEIIRKELETSQKSTVEPLLGEVRAVKGEVELNKFLAAHPEISEGDVDPLLKIMDKYPEIMNRRDRLEVYYKLLKLENPEIGSRTTQRKKELEKSASDAKTAATLGGRGSSTPKQPEGDEMDEIIAMNKERNAYFNRL